MLTEPNSVDRRNPASLVIRISNSQKTGNSPPQLVKGFIAASTVSPKISSMVLEQSMYILTISGHIFLQRLVDYMIKPAGQRLLIRCLLCDKKVLKFQNLVSQRASTQVNYW